MSERDTIRLATGKELYAFHGILGLGPDCETLTEGYDGKIEGPWMEPEEHVLTPAERVELADLMIARWQAYRERWSR